MHYEARRHTPTKNTREVNNYAKMKNKPWKHGKKGLEQAHDHEKHVLNKHDRDTWHEKKEPQKRRRWQTKKGVSNQVQQDLMDSYQMVVTKVYKMTLNLI